MFIKNLECMHGCNFENFPASSTREVFAFNAAFMQFGTLFTKMRNPGARGKSLRNYSAASTISLKGEHITTSSPFQSLSFPIFVSFQLINHSIQR